MNAKYQGLLICFMLYTIAFIVGIYAANQTLATHQWIIESIAHLAATSVVFAGSFINKNSRNLGHKAGLKTVETIIRSSVKNNIKF